MGRERARVHAELEGPGGVGEAGADLEPGAGLGVAAVVAQSAFQRRRQHRAGGERERARAFEHHAQPARRAFGARKAGDGAGGGPGEARVGAQRELEAPSFAGVHGQRGAGAERGMGVGEVALDGGSRPAA